MILKQWSYPEEEIGDIQAAGPGNPQPNYEKLLANIVDFGKGNKSNNGQNDEGKNKKSHNIYFEGLFDADHG